MALRAKYEADFSDFYAAVAQATAGLGSWENQGAAVEKQMDGIANSLSDAPVEGAIQNVTTGVEHLGEQTGILEGIFLKVGGAMAAAFTVQQIGQFALGVIEAASEVGDLSVKLGLSTEAVQRFKYAADQSGSSIDNVGRSIQTMNQRLAEGSNSTIAALSSVGLELSTLRDSGPEAAFIAIGDAVAGIEDPMERVRVATEIFGKSGAENLQLFLAGIQKVGSETKVMSDDTIKSLKAAEDAWNRLYNTATVATGGIIAKGFQIADTFSVVFKAMTNPGDKDAVQAMTEMLLKMTGSLDQATEAAPKFGLRAAGLAPVALTFSEIETTIDTMNKTLGQSHAALDLVEPKLGNLATFTRAAGKETESLKNYLFQAAEAVDVFNTGLTFTSEVIGDLPGDIAAVNSAIAGSSFLGPKGGGGTIDTSGITISDQDELWRRYNATYGNGAGGIGRPMVGGGEDVLSFGLRSGLATRGGPAISNTFNIVDTESEIARRVSDTIAGQIQRGSLVN